MNTLDFKYYTKIVSPLGALINEHDFSEVSKKSAISNPTQYLQLALSHSASLSILQLVLSLHLSIAQPRLPYSSEQEAYILLWTFGPSMKSSILPRM